MWYSVVGGIVILTLSILMAPLAAEAQSLAKIPRIGWLSLGSPPSETDRQQSPFVQGLRELGWVEGQNLVVEWRFAEGRPERLADLAADLIHRKVDIMVTPGTAAAYAKQATTSIPIVVAGAGFPVETGLVNSLARPGGNVTGVAFQTGPENVGKRLQLLKEAAPWIIQVGILWDPDDPTGTFLWQQAQAAAEALGLTPQSLEVPASSRLEQLVVAITRKRPDALYVGAYVFTNLHAREIADFAAMHRLPSISSTSTYVKAGGLMSYGANSVDIGRRAATLVDKILKGAKPADLPMEQPTKFDLVINLKTTQAMGLTIPPTLLFQADEVIH